MQLRPPHAPLEDGELTLRPLRSADLPALARACADPALASWVWPAAHDAVDAARRLLEDAERGWSERAASLAAVDPDGEVLAFVQLQFDDDPAVAEIGIWVADARRGQGMGTSVTRLVADWALRELGVERLWIEIDPANTASHRIAERLGFHREGRLRAHCFDRQTGGRRDCVIYSLLPGEL